MSSALTSNPHGEISEALLRTGHAVVLGLGISNLPLVRWLCARGLRVTACDRKEEISLDCADELHALGVSLSLGEAYLSPLSEGCFVIFRSPGIRPDAPEIAAAVSRGCLLASEMELFFERCPAHIIGVTGSDGKTTTTTLIYKMLSLECDKNGRGRVFVGGNIGAPLLPEADGMTDQDFAVVELSSFQLMTMRRSPEIAVITNITPNHLNWHIDMDEYVSAKRRICEGTGCIRLVTNADCKLTSAIAPASPTTALFSRRGEPTTDDAVFLRDGCIILRIKKHETEIISASDILLPGQHNTENYLAAIGATAGLVSRETVAEIVRSFSGVEHRCELVRELDGVRYFNSSIDSTPTRTAAALSSFPQKVIVIIGGRDKHLPLEPLAKTLTEHARAVVLTGESVSMVEQALHDCPQFSPEHLLVVVHEEFTEAVEASRELATRGDIVILSPAFTSFDRFHNFEERGRLFKTIVNSFESNNKGSSIDA